MKALKYLGIIAIVLVAAVVILMFIAPTDFSIERSISIEAPKNLVKEQIVHLEKSQEWSPWANLDSNIEEWYEGEMGAVGSKHFWNGNDDVGEGMQELTALGENKVEMKVTFLRPFKSEANSYFNLSENESGTEVIWGFSSSMPRPLNIFTLFMDFEESIGKDYEKGLSSLKEVSEKLSEESASAWQIDEVDFQMQSFITSRKVVGFDEMEAFYQSQFEAIYTFIGKNENLQIAGNSSSIYYDWNEENRTSDAAAAVPFIAKNENQSINDFEVISLSGKAYKLNYIGDYNGLGDAHMAMHKYLEQNNIAMSDVVLETYAVGPSQESDSSKWQTEIYYFAN